MAEVIDALFFELGFIGDFEKKADTALAKMDELDSSFDKLDNKNKKLETTTKKSTKSTEDNAKSLAKHEKQTKQNVKAANDLLNVVTGFTKAIGALGVMMMAGIGLDKLAAEAAKANVALDNSAKNIGISTNELKAWQGAAEMAGGSADGMASYLGSLSSGISKMVIMGDTSLVPFFNTFGVGVLDSSGKMRDLNDILLDLSDSMSKMDRTQAHTIATSMGMDEGTFNLLIQGREHLENTLSSMSKIYKSNAEDIETSRKLTAATSYLNQQFDGLQLMIANAVSPVLLKIAELTTTFFEFLQKHEGLVKGVFLGIAGAISVALIPVLLQAAAATFAFMAPFLPVIAIVLALGLAFGVLYDDYKTWANGGKSLFDWGLFGKWFEDANFSAENLMDGFAHLVGGYEDWAELASDAGSWLKLKGFIKDGKVSVESLAEGFKNIGKDIVGYLMPVLDRLLGILLKIIRLDFEGVGEDIKQLGSDAVDWVADTATDAWNGLTNWWNGVEERAPAALDKAAGFDPEKDGSINKSTKTGAIYNQNGFNSAENALIQEMNNLGYSDEEKAMFLATTRHESANYKRMRESGKYRTVEQMQKANIKRAIEDPEGAKRAIEQGEEATLEFMYGGRMGNNNAGDGAKYRGRGPIQITGKANYEKIGKKLGVDLVSNPELLEKDPALAIRASMIWWEDKKREDKGFRNAIKNNDFRRVTYGVNGGYNGWDDRLVKYNAVMRELKSPNETLNIGDEKNSLSDQPLAGAAVAKAVTQSQPAINNMQSLAQGQNVTNNSKTDVVVNGGVVVNSSANTISGVGSDFAEGVQDRVAPLMRHNVGVD